MLKSNKIHCKDCDIKSHFFKYLKNEQVDIVDLNKIEISFKAGEIIMKQGTPITQVVFIKSGYGKVYMEGNNKDLILGITIPGRYINGPGLYYDNISHYTVSSLTNVETCFIDAIVFKNFVKTNIDFANAFLREFCRRSISTFDAFYGFTQKKMYGRLAMGILYLSEVFASLKFDVLLSKKELGELTNMTKESVIRTLNQLEKEGIIIFENGTLEIKDMDRLKKISQKG